MENDSDNTPNAAVELMTEPKQAVSKPKATHKPASKPAKPAVPAAPKTRQAAGAVDDKYIAAHRTGLAHVAKALGFTLDEFVATRTSKGILSGYRNVDVRAHRPVTARVFAQVSEKEWGDTRSVFAFVCCRSERLADALRATGSKARK